MTNPLRIVLLTLLLAPVCAADVTIGRDSNLIIERTGPAEAELQIAADLLENYLTAALGRDTLAGDGAPVTFRLEADAVIWYQLPEDKRTSLGAIDAFTVTVGDDGVTIHGSTVLSACYGVYDFLENDLGVVWLFPGDLGTHVPNAASFTFKSGSRRVTPDVTSRLYTGLRFNDQDRKLNFRQTYDRDHPLFGQRHFFEGHDYHQSLKLHFLASPSHNMINIFPPAWSLEHPQVLPMLEDGTRYQPALSKEENKAEYQAWHPCYTDELTVTRTIEKAREAFAAGAMCYSLGINDGRRVQCQCSDCRAVGWPGSYYQYVTKVANAVKDTYPPHVLGVLVYGDVRNPEPDMKLPDNVICMISGASTLEQWSTHATHLGRYGYFFGVDFYIPSFALASMKHNAALFAKYGVRSFRAEVHPVWAFDAPKVYLQSRLLWDLHDDTDAALSRWCDAAFGDGGPAMKWYFLHWASKWDYLAQVRGQAVAPYCAMGRWRRAEAQFAMCTAEDFQFCADRIAEARREVKPGKQADRLTMFETYFERARYQFDTYNLVQGLFADAGSQQSDLVGLAQRVERNAARVDELDATIGAADVWRLGTSGDKKSEAGYSTIENEMFSGMLTAALSLPEARRGEAPAKFAPYFEGDMTTTPVKRIKTFDSGGWYWAMPRVQYMFEPLTASSDGHMHHAKHAGVNPVIETGTKSGQYEQHWSFSLVPMRPGEPGQRRLMKFDMEVTGEAGDLHIYFGNMWAGGEDGHHLPVTVSVSLDEPGVTHKRTIIVEPTEPESARHDATINVRFAMLFTPDHDGSTCEIKTQIHEIRIDQAPGAETQ